MHRQRIKAEANEHGEYGVEQEQELNAILQDASMSKGRTRRRINQLKAMGAESGSARNLNSGGASGSASASGIDRASSSNYASVASAPKQQVGDVADVQVNEGPRSALLNPAIKGAKPPMPSQLSFNVPSFTHDSDSGANNFSK